MLRSTSDKDSNNVDRGMEKRESLYQGLLGYYLYLFDKEDGYDAI